MPKLSIIQCVYNRNPYIFESTKINLFALERAGVDYELIIFNDHGDVAIKDDLKDIVSHPRVVYVYSDVNYGKGKCSGGWRGGIPYMKGELVHFANQDDVYTPMFYQMSLKEHEDPAVMMTHTNAFSVYENLTCRALMMQIEGHPDYYNDPFGSFKLWFGVGKNGHDEVTAACNNVLAPSVIYKKVLHELIGLPDPETYLGSCDFEYWARILFYGHKCKYIKQPLWLYRTSQHSTSTQVEVKDINLWIKVVKDKYAKLYEEKKRNA